MMLRKLTAVLLVALTSSVASLAFQATKPDISGTWTGKSFTPKEGAPPTEESLYAVLKQNGSELTGTVGPSVERQFPITTGKVETGQEGTTVSFQQGREGHRNFFTAKLIDDVLKGTVNDEYYKTTFQIELRRSK